MNIRQFIRRKTDREWEKFGTDDPYFGVIADEKYRAAHLTETGKEAFFRSGAEYIDYVLGRVRQLFSPDWRIGKALDFGCGVGRLVIPLATHARAVTGVDVSDAMLAEARRNCTARSIGNATFVKSDDDLSRLDQTYDFIHSTIAFQHIPVPRGEHILKRLLTLLEPEGIGVLHFSYAEPRRASWAARINHLAIDYLPFYRNVRNARKGRGFFYPEMRMHAYDMSAILSILQTAGIANFHAEFTDHGGFLGITLYFRKPRSD
ncbi:hypothetical protein A9404_08415 [Halothiobacillus diazotrophicus]|uniref:Methyltransferase domain-containing protein n=1 Tax=Halothiobacillus diazotrophicus TaxID=1860122 RepID=A0A191ZHN7_9GAMM|nr:class I SAM-dependent methyltransferase [Halothiobacillus diazotrophicus]ANJ67399.1 hypothetical protein A9404_08415 [Halothiobacillus diazotrophicus]